jgi:CheY-like chemotaxis protein
MIIDQKHSILIVDDDPDDRESIRDAFLENYKRLNYVFFSGADELLKYLEGLGNEGHPSVILLDLNMPGMDSRDALKQLKSSHHFRHIPIVVLTTSSSAHDKQNSYSLGANCFVTKPDTFTKLVNITDSIAKLWVA